MPKITKKSGSIAKNSYTFVIDNFKDDWIISTLKLTPTDAKYTITRQNNKLTVVVNGGTKTGSGNNGRYDTFWIYQDLVGGTCPSTFNGYAFTNTSVNTDGKTLCNYQTYISPTEYWDLYSYTLEVNYTTEILNGTISSQKPGSVVSFGGEQFIVLNPSTGYLVREAPLESKKAYNTTTGIAYDPTNTKSVANYLNADYYNSFSTEAQEAILSKSWGIGTVNTAQAGNTTNTPTVTLEAMRVLENASTVEAKIGMLSASEWRTYSSNTNHAGTSGILPAPAVIEYLITPNSATANLTIATTGLISSQTSTSTANIRPTLYVNPKLKVLDSIVILNTKPTMTLIGRDTKVFINSTLQLNGEALDLEVDSVLEFKFKLDGGIEQTLLSEISNGTSIPFTLDLLYTSEGMQFNGFLITEVLREGNHTLEVWVEDDSGGISEVKIFSFQLFNYHLPEITLVESKGEKGNVLVLKVSDRSGSISKVDLVVNEELIKALVPQITNFAEPFEFTVTTDMLVEGDNELLVYATNNLGATATSVLNLNLYLPLTPFIPDTENFSIGGALSIVDTEGLENFVEMTAKPVGLSLTKSEVQLVGSNTRNAKTTQRITLKRASADIDYNVNLYTGAID